jgi:hypothetical protein
MNIPFKPLINGFQAMVVRGAALAGEVALALKNATSSIIYVPLEHFVKCFQAMVVRGAALAREVALALKI